MGEAKDNEKNSQNSGEEVTDVGERKMESDSLQDLVKDLQAQLQKAQNDYLYLRAEFDNYRRQTIKERAEMLKYGGEKLAKDLLETLDIFETALEPDVSPENWEAFVKGVKLTAQQLNSALSKHGIVPVHSTGKPFDPNVHEALGSEHTEEIPAGHVSRVFKKPYMYQDKLLRPGQVIVAKDKKENNS